MVVSTQCHKLGIGNSGGWLLVLFIV